ncbi:hypothetical protein GH714_028464 [Hevea brasiliensis]|uniref:Disease resistance protein At4g27190-like leucine-rich repeats domain-containing protein n=1 Tax=Hevea brasiliensis TaxID=3981 RepID=A0A6A6LND8_HEVBR|nr:hypothetical protein GH714_028464 [Hevea brasiliensis]
MRMVISEETPQTVQLDRVGGWLSRADATITEVNILLNRAIRERQKLCLAGCCSRNSPNLTYLFVGENKHIEEIISVEKLDDVQVGDENFNPFFKLEYLILDELPELKSIYPKALSFPSLKRIEVYKCPQLKKLPLNSSSANGGKVEIEAEERWWKDVEWEDDSTKTTFLPCFVPSRHRY